MSEGMFWVQFAAISAKNWRINQRAKEYLRENIAVVILCVFVIILEHAEPNNFATPMYMGIAMAGYSRSIAVWWLTEKETHQKELQKIMGVSQFNYIVSWLAYFLANGTIVTCVMMLIVRLLVINDSTVFAEGMGFWNIAALYFLYSVANIGFVMVLCTFFSKAKTGSQAITFLQLILNFLYFLRFSTAVTSSSALTLLLSLFPQFCYNVTISNVAFINKGGSSISNNFDLGFNQGCLTFAVTSVVFVLLALYLDEVVPNEMGTHRHPLFFLGVGYKAPEELLHERLLSGQDCEQESSAKYEQRVERTQEPVARLAGVSKSFGAKRAIDGLSLNFYESEIFCLLGHNGAGKSTTINLLTGLLAADSGQVSILGQSYPHGTDEIRKNIGLCLQHNVLYDELTVEEHLRYYFRIKNRDQARMEQEVERIVQQCALDSERGKVAKNLSGGNKRKLCLGNSLIGGARLIFLDEPSSGLDPNSRQAIWGILKSIQSERRCVILTTHHLEEAEFLSRRIAIMSQGRLIIVGSREFITDKFSVGYHVVVTLNRSQPSSADRARDIIRKNIARSVEDQQSAANTVKFIFPLGELPNFSRTLRLLEEAAVGEVSLFTSNLEDAFVRIGEEEEQLSEGFREMGLPAEGEREKELAGQAAEELRLPEVACAYSFGSQMKAIFKRKMKTTLRSFSSVVSVVMPTAFMSIGVLVVCLAIPNNETDPVDRVGFDRVRLFIMSYFMIWAFVFTTSSYCGDVVLEREKRFKYLSNVSGARQLPYWAGNYAFDLILFYLPLSVFFVIAFALGSEGTFITDFAGYLVAALFLFGFSFIGYSYLFSFVFQKSSSAYRFFPFINLLFFYFLPSIPSTLNNNQGVLAQYVMPLLSPFVAYSSVFNTVQVVGSDQGQSFAYNNLWYCYACFLIQAVLYFCACHFLEGLRFSLKSSPQELALQNQQASQAYSNAEEEIREHINCRASQNAEAPIRIEGLTKVYGNGFMAVRNNSFAVRPGEIFGLLGPNGAGKSTTFNIVTAALPKTSGSVQIFNQEVNKGIMDIFENVGVCPQYNPIYENLTVFEHLEYFCLVKGLPAADIRPTIDFYADLLSLRPYLHVKAGVLSGGNKRKMCVGMAMVGNPQVAFFDEPSAGVDPISRRFLWKCLAASAKSKRTAMVLTTHSMNEAESLCAEIGILIRGQFVCLDSPKQLKEKYGQGYRVNVTASVELQGELIAKVKGCFGEDVQVERIEGSPEFLVFIIKNASFKLSRAFELFEDELSSKGKIQRYEIKESTLEEVFIHLSRLQPYVEEVTYAEPWELLCWEWGTNGCVIAL